MAATIVNESADSLTIQVMIPFNRSMRLGGRVHLRCTQSSGNLGKQKFSEAIRHGWLTDNNW